MGNWLRGHGCSMDTSVGSLEYFWLYWCSKTILPITHISVVPWLINFSWRSLWVWHSWNLHDHADSYLLGKPVIIFSLFTLVHFSGQHPFWFLVSASCWSLIISNVSPDNKDECCTSATIWTWQVWVLLDPVDISKIRVESEMGWCLFQRICIHLRGYILWKEMKLHFSFTSFLKYEEFISTLII